MQYSDVEHGLYYKESRFNVLEVLRSRKIDVRLYSVSIGYVGLGWPPHFVIEQSFFLD